MSELTPRDRFISRGASVLVGITTGVIVFVLGGPVWAAFGFGYLTYQIVRTRHPE